MSGADLDERTRLGSGLEVVINPADRLDIPMPVYSHVLDLLTAVDEVVRVVKVAQRVKESGVEEFDELPDELDVLSRDVIHQLEMVVEQIRSDVVGSGRVHLRSISMNSPLTLELVTTGVSGASLISAVVYLFRNPDKIGSWFPRLQTSWYNGRVEAEKAKRAYEKLHKARARLRELEP
ncbi:hypothetical protein [Nonomuraea wenchangensis]|uniref:hypothetical protein n=1 Tax=Nonomuraea wenchangensis TaxID=568860 RepID=UPI00379FA375